MNLNKRIIPSCPAKGDRAGNARLSRPLYTRDGGLAKAKLA
jgi:hypothetical protein